MIGKTTASLLLFHATGAIALDEFAILDSQSSPIATASRSGYSRHLASTIRSFAISITFNNFVNYSGDLSVNFDGANGGPVGVVTFTAPGDGETETFTSCLAAAGETEIIPDTSDEEDELLAIEITPSVCVCDVEVCFDPHLQGLRGQHIEWTGVDGGWYALVKDDDDDLQINIRTTSPLPDDFPEREFITGLSVLSQGHSLSVEVTDPYSTSTAKCPTNVSPCLADGGLSVFVDGKEMDSLTGPSNDVHLPGGIELAAFNLSPECRELGGRSVWGRTQTNLGGDRRQVTDFLSFEEWMLNSNNMLAPEYCAAFVASGELSRVQSDQALVRIVTPTAMVRLSVGINQRRAGKIDRFGRYLPGMAFWQMSVGVDGLSLEHESLSGLLGETAHVVVDAEGNGVTKGIDGSPRTVEEYRVSDAEGRNFDRLHYSTVGLN